MLHFLFGGLGILNKKGLAFCQPSLFLGNMKFTSSATLRHLTHG